MPQGNPCASVLAIRLIRPMSETLGQAKDQHDDGSLLKGVWRRCDGMDRVVPDTGCSDVRICSSAMDHGVCGYTGAGRC